MPSKVERSGFEWSAYGLTFSDLSASALDVEIGTSWNYLDNLTIMRGRHTWKMGVEIRRIWLNNTGEALPLTTVTYASSQNFINNVADSIAMNAALGVGGNRRTFWMGFAQDEFKVRPSLALTLGVRYDYYGVMHEALGRSLVVDPVSCGGFCPAGTPYYSPDRNNFAPRLGLVWSPARFKGKTAIRAGFGVFYGANQNDDFSDPHESTAARYSLSSAVVSNLSYAPARVPPRGRWNISGLGLPDPVLRKVYRANASRLVGLGA